jgi:cytochrome P450
MEGEMTEITLSDLLAQETKGNSHAFYAQLRGTSPMIFVEGLDTWLLTTYEDALWLFKDPRFTKDRRKLPERAEQQDESWGTFVMRNLLMVDPPDHSRLRSLVSKACTPIEAT